MFDGIGFLVTNLSLFTLQQKTYWGSEGWISWNTEILRPLFPLTIRRKGQKLFFFFLL